MLSADKIARINELSRKAKTTGLTPSEVEEQKQLRQQYLQSFRESFKRQLHSVTVIDKNGNDVTPTTLKLSKASNRINH